MNKKTYELKQRFLKDIESMTEEVFAKFYEEAHKAGHAAANVNYHDMLNREERNINESYKRGYAACKSELGQYAIDLAHEESDRAYKQGFEDGKKYIEKVHYKGNQDDYVRGKKTGYRFGTEDTWELIKKINAMTDSERYEIFGDQTFYWDEIFKMSPEECMEKIHNYEERVLAKNKCATCEYNTKPIHAVCNSYISGDQYKEKGPS